MTTCCELVFERVSVFFIWCFRVLGVHSYLIAETCSNSRRRVSQNDFTTSPILLEGLFTSVKCGIRNRSLRSRAIVLVLHFVVQPTQSDWFCSATVNPEPLLLNGLSSNYLNQNGSVALL